MPLGYLDFEGPGFPASSAFFCFCCIISASLQETGKIRETLKLPKHTHLKEQSNQSLKFIYLRRCINGLETHTHTHTIDKHIPLESLFGPLSHLTQLLSNPKPAGYSLQSMKLLVGRFTNVLLVNSNELICSRDEGTTTHVHQTQPASNPAELWAFPSTTKKIQLLPI